MVAGAMDWYANGLVIPAVVEEATLTEQERADRIRPFLEDKCVRSPGAWVTSAAIYQAYRAWAQEAGLQQGGPAGRRVVLTQEELGQRLRQHGFKDTQRGKSRVRGWVGLGLLADGQGSLDMGG
jgi:phage/plasmid-associated DNA primase